MPFITDMFHEQNGTDLEPNDAAGRRAPGFDEDAFTAALGAHILGQEHAVTAVGRAVAIAQAGIADRGRPLASILLVGPTGVGKTDLVRQVAAQLRSGPDDLCRIDMAALAQEHYAASFSGAPPGYAGSKESFTVFQKDKIEGDPFMPGIVLFDEIEKADTTVIRALLHVLDCGQLRLANGRETISFRNSYIFLTSNLGSHAVAREQRSKSTRRRWNPRRTVSARHSRDLIRHAAEDFFDPEFFNRIDETVVMDPIAPSTARAITEREVELLTARLARESVTLVVNHDVVTFLHDRGFDPVYGARGLRRALRQHLIAPVATALLKARPAGREPIGLTADLAAGKVVVGVS
jgi:ATP-dependent Clp protease ATP-binding subunit ClpA